VAVRNADRHRVHADHLGQKHRVLLEYPADLVCGRPNPISLVLSLGNPDHLRWESKSELEDIRHKLRGITHTSTT